MVCIQMKLLAKVDRRPLGERIHRFIYQRCHETYTNQNQKRRCETVRSERSEAKNLKNINNASKPCVHLLVRNFWFVIIHLCAARVGVYCNRKSHKVMRKNCHVFMTSYACALVCALQLVFVFRHQHASSFNKVTNAIQFVVYDRFRRHTHTHALHLE